MQVVHGGYSLSWHILSQHASESPLPTDILQKHAQELCELEKENVGRSTGGISVPSL